MSRLLLVLLLWVPAFASSIELPELAGQLRATPLVRGDFEQEKRIPGLSRPLLSRGQFVLVPGQGLLWRLRSPLTLDYRITPRGMAGRQNGRWQPVASSPLARDQQLFLALLSGDVERLGRDFQPQLSGNQAHWQLQLLPRSVLLRQLFRAIRLSGSDVVEEVQLDEVSGEQTRLRLVVIERGGVLSTEETSDLAR